MTVTITTHWPKLVQEVMSNYFPWEVESHFHQGERKTELVGSFRDEVCFTELNGWGADALACGLIFGFQVER